MTSIKERRTAGEQTDDRAEQTTTRQGRVTGTDSTSDVVSAPDDQQGGHHGTTAGEGRNPQGGDVAHRAIHA